MIETLSMSLGLYLVSKRTFTDTTSTAWFRKETNEKTGRIKANVCSCGVRSDTYRRRLKGRDCGGLNGGNGRRLKGGKSSRL